VSDVGHVDEGRAITDGAPTRWLMTAFVLVALVIGVTVWRWPRLPTALFDSSPDSWALSINGGTTKNCYRVTTGLPPRNVFDGIRHVAPRIFKLTGAAEPSLAFSDVVVPLRVVWVGPSSRVTGSAVVAPGPVVTVTPPGPATLSIVFEEGTTIGAVDPTVDQVDQVDQGQWWATAPPTVKLVGPCGLPPPGGL
jgi:hypothetical protein